VTKTLHHITIQNCTNLRKSWIEIPKSNPIILRILSGNKGVKTVLETVLRTVIASVVLEQWWDKNLSPIGYEIEGFYSKIDQQKCQRGTAYVQNHL